VFISRIVAFRAKVNNPICASTAMAFAFFFPRIDQTLWLYRDKTK